MEVKCSFVRNVAVEWISVLLIIMEICITCSCSETNYARVLLVSFIY
jgi:hypothetical protein